jgi:hypothetical protein
MPALRDYEGHLIRFTEERWAHISGHPEMVGMLRAVEETLGAPEVVVQSASDPEARLYYRFYPQTLVGGKYLCTVVKVKADDAFVVTAYLTDQVKKGTVVWRRKP